MESINAVQLVMEEKGVAVHCHHDSNCKLSQLIEIFERYGLIKLIEPVYSFKGARLEITKIYYIKEQDAKLALDTITAIGQGAQSRLLETRNNNLASLTTSTLHTHQNTLRQPTGMVAEKISDQNDKKMEDYSIEGGYFSKENLPLEIHATEENPYYVLHEEGRKIHILIPKGQNYERIFQEMRPYGKIEYIHELENKEKKRIALICFYESKSAEKALMQINPLCRPRWARTQKITDYKGKIYRLHDRCNKIVNVFNFSNHRRICDLEYKYAEGSTARTNQENTDAICNARQVMDEKERRVLINITTEDSISSLKQEFEKYGLLEYIKPNIESGVAYICFFDKESAYRAISKAETRYNIRKTEVETLIGFQGPLKRTCKHCLKEVSSPHLNHHFTVCKKEIFKKITLEERIQRARERAYEENQERKGHLKDSINTDEAAASVHDLIDFERKDDETVENEKMSIPTREDNNNVDEENVTDTDDDRSVIIEGELLLSLSPVEEIKTSPSIPDEDITSESEANEEDVNDTIKAKDDDLIDTSNENEKESEEIISSSESKEKPEVDEDPDEVVLLIKGKFYKQQMQDDGKIILVPIED